MKYLLLILLSISPLYATRFEFTPFNFPSFPIGAEGTGFIETSAPTGFQVPIQDAVSSFQLRGFIGTSLGLPDIPAPIFDSLAGFTLTGTMTWDLSSLTGDWSINSPPVQAQPPLIGATVFVARPDGIDSKYPLEYFPSQTFLVGSWQAVPDTGSSLLLMLGALAAMLPLKTFLTRSAARAILPAE